MSSDQWGWLSAKVHVVATGDRIADPRTRGLVAEAVESSAGPPELETILLDGDPAAVLAEQGVEFDLLVVGSRG